MIRPWEYLAGWGRSEYSWQDPSVSAVESTSCLGRPATSAEAVTEAVAEAVEGAPQVPPAYVGPLPRSVFTHFEDASALVVSAEAEVLACLAAATVSCGSPWAAARELFGGEAA